MKEQAITEIKLQTDLVQVLGAELFHHIETNEHEAAQKTFDRLVAAVETLGSLLLGDDL